MHTSRTTSFHPGRTPVGQGPPELVVRRFIQEVYNKGNLSALRDLVHPNFHFHDLETVGVHLEDLTLHYAYLHVNWNSIFREHYFHIRDIQRKGDALLVRLQKRGLYREEVSGSRGQKRCIENRTEAYRIIDGRVKEWWIVSSDTQVTQDNLS